MSKRTVKLYEVAETSSGGTPARGNKKYYGGSIPWIKSGELPDGEILTVEENITKEALEDSSTKLLEAGTLLIAMYGATVGKLGILTFPATTNQAVCAIHPKDDIDRDYLFYYLLRIRKDLITASFGGAQPNISQNTVQNLIIPLPNKEEQRKIAAALNAQLAEVEKAKAATICQLSEVETLANAIVYESLNKGETTNHALGDVLTEVKHGIGSGWASYPVYGATRAGLALAKEPPGKTPQRYKPITPGTVFYNPMRILIGSIAYAEDDVEAGITSPDYVVLKGKKGLVDSRWFYFWLRSPLGEQCINSLARGAVRERMLFNRLADGVINLPDFATQQRASESLANLKHLRTSLLRQLDEIKQMPNRLLSTVFEGV